MAQAYYAKSLSVTTDETVIDVSAEFSIDMILLIANDSATGDLMVKFDGLGASVSDWMVFKPGESIKNLELPAKVMRVKSSTGTVVGRFLGINN